MTYGPKGTQRNSNSVTIPKLPPPPRTPQNRSAFRSALACKNSPSAVTRSTETSWSIDNPCLRMIQPVPPPGGAPRPPPRPANDPGWLSVEGAVPDPAIHVMPDVHSLDPRCRDQVL